jgi:hypothetical protein
MMAKQAGASPEMIISGLGMVIKLMKCIRPIRQLYLNPIVFYGMLIFIISLVLKWTGFVEKHLF